MDPLAEVIRSIRLVGGIFVDAEFTAPWAVHAQVTPDECQMTGSEPVQMIAYHVIFEGTLLATLDGQSIAVHAGEAVLFPRNGMHVLSSEAGLPSVRARTLIDPVRSGEMKHIRHGGGGDRVQLVCGYMASETLYNPLIASLPGMLKLDVREGASRDWVEASVRFAADELANGRLASSGLISKLSELLLVEAVRAYATTLGDQRPAG